MAKMINFGLLYGMSSFGLTNARYGTTGGSEHHPMVFAALPLWGLP